MKIYTFQRQHVWDTVNELGYYHPFDLFQRDTFLKEDMSYPWGFTKAYQWRRQAMLDKGVHYMANCQHLIWGWYHWNGTKQKKPDRRYRSVYDYFEGESYVLLELEIDPKRIILSDYDLWHWVLNYWYAGKSREAERFAKIYDYYKQKPLPEPGHQLIEKTWHTIFDLDKSRHILNTPKKKQQIEATFFELFYTDIREVHFFNNKKCTSTISLNHAS